jgi:cyclic beta-1,2-glucan synthetase
MAFARLGDHDRAWELFDLLNPSTTATRPSASRRYKVEPYVVAADVYAVAPHTGRGGWTWYTGSAGWMYRLLVETLLGVQRAGDQLRILPRLHPGWTSYKIHYRFGQTVYHITVQHRAADAVGPSVRLLDGQPLDGDAIRLVDDQREHAVEWPV